MRIHLLSLVLLLAACSAPTTQEHQAAAPSDSSVAATNAPAPTLFGGSWRLVELQGEAIASSPEGTPAHLAFQAADSTVSGSGGCNRLFGPFHLQGAAGLRFGNLASTQMACPNMALEGRLHAALPTVDGYALRGDTLVMLHGEQVVALWGKGE